jgi:hypothetical protein
MFLTVIHADLLSGEAAVWRSRQGANRTIFRMRVMFPAKMDVQGPLSSGGERNKSVQLRFHTEFTSSSRRRLYYNKTDQKSGGITLLIANIS